MDVTEFQLEPGQQVLVARAGAEEIEAASGTIVSHDGANLMVMLQQRLELVMPGVLMIVRPSIDGLTAWATAESIKGTSDGVSLTLKITRWEDAEQPRANRMRMGYDVDLTYRTPMSNLGMKRTIGSTVDISMTGMRIKTRTPVANGSVAHVHLFISPERRVELLARVVRVVAGTEASSGGFEVGMVFIRFLKGYDDLVEIVWLAEEEMSSDGGSMSMDYSQPEPVAETPEPVAPTEAEPTSEPAATSEEQAA